MIFPIDSTGENQESFFIEQYGGVSVSNVSVIAPRPVPFERQNIGPSQGVKLKSRVDLQVKTDSKLGTPARNGSNQGVSLHFSSQTNLLPDQMSVAGIGCWIEIVSSKDFHFFKCPGIFIFHVGELFPIDCYSEINLS